MDTENKLQVANLSCIRQQKSLFTNLSFHLQSGEVLLIEGPNGSGKSSLLRILTGLSTPSEGDVYWRGEAIQHCRDHYIQQVHYMGHSNGLKLGLTVAENLQLACHLSLSPLTTAFTQVLTQLQLSDYKDTLAKNLSAGQKRRIALAKLFLIPKKIWLLDEPLTALDTATQTLFLSKLETHLHNGGMAVLSSHHAIAFKKAVVKQLRFESC